ncbi:MAG: type VI secretion system lipoprotein TssJ [Ignavibacteriales bacterium]|nr:type VI secretion system lipoprotein TssJ [Ignavibacteriales bacterium]
MKKLFLLLPFLVTSFVLSGCGGVQTVKINLKCDDDCNNNNAIVIRIYQLKNADKFRNASFESLIRSPEEILADDLIPNSKFEKTLVPGESVQSKEIEIKKDAAYLGVVGDFFSPAKDGWLQIISLDSGNDKFEIVVHENSLSYKNE